MIQLKCLRRSVFIRNGWRLKYIRYCKLPRRISTCIRADSEIPIFCQQFCAITAQRHFSIYSFYQNPITLANRCRMVGGIYGIITFFDIDIICNRCPRTVCTVRNRSIVGNGIRAGCCRFICGERIGKAILIRIYYIFRGDLRKCMIIRIINLNLLIHAHL